MKGHPFLVAGPLRPQLSEEEVAFVKINTGLAKLTTLLRAERERAEKAEAERDRMYGLKDGLQMEWEKAEADLREARELLQQALSQRDSHVNISWLDRVRRFLAPPVVPEKP